MTWETVFALLSREYGWTLAQILKLTKPQVRFYLRFARNYDKRELEYEEVPGAKEYMRKVAAAYKRAGREMPDVIG